MEHSHGWLRDGPLAAAAAAAKSKPAGLATEADPSRVTALAKAVSSGLRRLITAASSSWSSVTDAGVQNEKQREDDKADQPGGTGRQPTAPAAGPDL